VTARQTITIVEPSSLSLTLLPGRAVELKQSRVPGQFWRLERSVNLKAWSVISAQTNTANSTSWLDELAGFDAACFYRLKRP